MIRLLQTGGVGDAHRCGYAGAPSDGVCIWRPWNIRYTWTCGFHLFLLILLLTGKCDAGTEKRRRVTCNRNWCQLNQWKWNETVRGPTSTFPQVHSETCPWTSPGSWGINADFSLTLAPRGLVKTCEPTPGWGCYLLPAAPVVAHVPLQLRAVREGVTAVWAAVVVLAGLVAILNVLLQRGVAFVAPGAVRARVQLGEGVRCSCGNKNTRRRW